VLSDIGSYQGRGFETAAEFNLRLDAIAAQVTDGPDDTVVLPERVQKKDARVHFDPEQVERVERCYGFSPKRVFTEPGFHRTPLGRVFTECP
jgi:hypothetical protein